MDRFDLIEFLRRFIDSPDQSPLFEIVAGLASPKPEGPWIAGGAIRRTLLQEPLASDIDYFFRDEEQKANFVADILGFTACSGVLASILEATVADPQTIHRDTEYVD
jgi:hypothetical protein